jgi:hypothetical protein
MTVNAHSAFSFGFQSPSRTLFDFLEEPKPPDREILPLFEGLMLT